jgi:hypothetical protein
VSHGRSDLVCSFIMKLRCKTLFFILTCMKTGLKNKTQPVLVKPSTSKQTNGTQSSCGCKFATSNRKSFPVEMDVSSATQDPYFASFRACVDRMMILYG